MGAPRRRAAAVWAGLPAVRCSVCAVPPMWPALPLLFGALLVGGQASLRSSSRTPLPRQPPWPPPSRCAPEQLPRTRSQS